MKILTARHERPGARRREQHHGLRRSGDVQVPGRSTWSSRVLVDERAARSKRCASYLLKGGFLIVDDFPQLGTGSNFELQMSAVFPEGHWIDLDVDASDLPFVLRDQLARHRPAGLRRSAVGRVFRALFEDNDPNKRMYVIANYQNDLSEFWECSEHGLRIRSTTTNEAYKVGINQFIYGITH